MCRRRGSFWNGIARVEPKVIEGRSNNEPVLALGQMGYAVDFQALAQSFVDETLVRSDAQERVSVMMNTKVTNLAREGALWHVSCGSRTIRARTVVMDTDAYSLLFAKRLGYGREFSLIPVAGTFFFTPEVLRGKVYTVQDPRLPFAAVHGDPDVRVSGVTRWGPTARFFPVLEARSWKTTIDYFRVSGLLWPRTWWSFSTILLDPVRFWYLVRNIFFEIPLISRVLFAREVRHIVPTLSWRDVRRARGFGGMRLQRVNTNTHELLLGEGKIVAENIIFNMSPSPGASVCLHNAVRDTERLIQFIGTGVRFRKEDLERELCIGTHVRVDADTSLRDSYVS